MHEAKDAALKQIESRRRDKVGPGEVARGDGEGGDPGGQNRTPPLGHRDSPKYTAWRKAVERRRREHVVTKRGKAVPQQHCGQREGPYRLGQDRSERRFVVK